MPCTKPVLRTHCAGYPYLVVNVTSLKRESGVFHSDASCRGYVNKLEKSIKMKTET